VATVAFYGPDDAHATKIAVGIVPAEGAEADPPHRWFSDTIPATWSRKPHPTHRPGPLAR
jgi:hypothetical protein